MLIEKSNLHTSNLGEINPPTSSTIIHDRSNSSTCYRTSGAALASIAITAAAYVAGSMVDIGPSFSQTLVIAGVSFVLAWGIGGSLSNCFQAKENENQKVQSIQKNDATKINTKIAQQYPENINLKRSIKSKSKELLSENREGTKKKSDGNITPVIQTPISSKRLGRSNSKDQFNQATLPINQATLPNNNSQIKSVRNLWEQNDKNAINYLKNKGVNTTIPNFKVEKNLDKRVDKGYREHHTAESFNAKIDAMWSSDNFKVTPGPLEQNQYVQKLIMTFKNITPQEFAASIERPIFWSVLMNKCYYEALRHLSVDQLRTLAETTLYTVNRENNINTHCDVAIYTLLQALVGDKTDQYEAKIRALAGTNHPALGEKELAVKVAKFDDGKLIMQLYNKCSKVIIEMRKKNIPGHFNTTIYEGKQYSTPIDRKKTPKLEVMPTVTWDGSEIEDFLKNILTSKTKDKNAAFQCLQIMDEAALIKLTQLLGTGNYLELFLKLEKVDTFGAHPVGQKHKRLTIILKNMTQDQIIKCAKNLDFWEILSRFDDRFDNPVFNGLSPDKFKLLIQNIITNDDYLTCENFRFLQEFIRRSKPEIEEIKRTNSRQIMVILDQELQLYQKKISKNSSVEMLINQCLAGLKQKMLSFKFKGS